jgi:hypothetical protein
MSTTTEKTAVSDETQSKLLATGSLFHALAADPKYRRKVLGLIKEASPETPIPELDMEAAVLRGVEERLKPEKESAERLQARLDSIEKRQIRDDWKNKFQLDDEEAVEVEQLAQKEQIGNGAVAVELYRSRQALGAPRSTRKTQPGTEEYLKKLHSVPPTNAKSLKQIAQDEATRIFASLKTKAS